MESRQSALTLVRVLLPIWIFYAVLYALLIQPFFGQATHGFLLWWKLLFPPLALGGVSYAMYARSWSASLPRLWLPFAQMQWQVLTFALVCGVWLALVPHAVVMYLHAPGHTPPMLYYGPWSVYDPLFLIANLFLLGSNYAEELFFRGLLYPYLRGKSGVIVANLITVVVFTVAHFPTTIDLVAVLIGLSLVMSFLVQRYDTLFYAFVAHSALNLTSFLLVTNELRPLFYGSGFGGELLLASCSLVLAFGLLYVGRKTSVTPRR